MGFSEWMSARGADWAIFTAATVKAAKLVADGTKKASQGFVNGIEAAKTGYQLEKAELISKQAKKSEEPSK